MKRTVLLLIVVMLSVALIGCAASSNIETQSSAAQEPSKTETTAVNETKTATPSDNANQADASEQSAFDTYSYEINDTGQVKFYDNEDEIGQPSEDDAFYGQDAQYVMNEMSFTDNGDGTITDNVTGLMWAQSPLESKLTWDEAVAGADDFDLAGYDDWRLPTIKEMYSLIDFSGEDVSTLLGDDATGNIPFIDTDYFDFEYGDTDAGERIIDVQYASSTKYVSTQDGELAFGVNMADGRIKGYWLADPMGREKTFVVQYVRNNEAYGQNDFVDNGDGTITDLSTGLMWMSSDSEQGMNWEDALSWSESLEYAQYDDWRLPDAKELQSIVDYTRSPDTTNSAAIDPMFDNTAIIDEGGEINYAFYWTSTTHASTRGGDAAVYIAFGEALGFMTQGPQQNGPRDPNSNPDDYTLMDVHGAGAQRSDSKIGEASDYPFGHGPQGDVVRINNFVRCVRYVEVG